LTADLRPYKSKMSRSVGNGLDRSGFASITGGFIKLSRIFANVRRNRRADVVIGPYNRNVSDL
jgi:hypothetical protein